MKLRANRLRRIISEEVNGGRGPSRGKRGIAEPKSPTYRILKQTHGRLLDLVLASPRRDAFIQQFIDDEGSANFNGEGLDALDAVALLAEAANEVV